MMIDENYMERLANAVAKTILDVIENLSVEDVNMYQICYNKAINDVCNKIDELEKKYTEQYGCEIVEMYADVVSELKQFLSECER